MPSMASTAVFAPDASRNFTASTWCAAGGGEGGTGVAGVGAGGV